MTTIDAVLREKYVPVLTEQVGLDVRIGPMRADALAYEWDFRAGRAVATLRVRRPTMVSAKRNAGRFARLLDLRMIRVRDEMLRTLGILGCPQFIVNRARDKGVLRG